MKQILKVLVALWASCTWASAFAAGAGNFDPVQDPPPAVLLDATRQDGSAEIGVGLPTWFPNGCFVVTANHVLRGDGGNLKPKTVTVFRQKRELDLEPFPTITVDGNGPYDAASDVAAFRVPLDEQACGRWESAKRLARGEKVFFIGRNGEWYIPTSPSIFNSPVQGNLLFDGMEAVPSMSGAPVYGEQGVVGIVIKRYGVNIALVSPISKALSMLTSFAGQRADDATMFAVDYEFARAMGTAYVKRNQAEFERTLHPGELGGGDAFFQDIVLVRTGKVNYQYSALGRGPLTAFVFWLMEGRGGGNHVEQMLSVFSPRAGRYEAKPDFEIEVGHRGFGYLDTPADQVSNDGDMIVFPGCLNDGTAMADAYCTVHADFYFGFCPENKSVKLVWFATLTDKESLKGLDPSLTSSLMGVEVKSGSQWNISPTAPPAMARAGLKAGTTVTMFEVDKITKPKLAARYGLRVSDLLASVGGTTVSSSKGFQCLLGERLVSSSSENVAVIKKSTGQMSVISVLSTEFDDIDQRQTK